MIGELVGGVEVVVGLGGGPGDRLGDGRGGHDGRGGRFVLGGLHDGGQCVGALGGRRGWHDRWGGRRQRGGRHIGLGRDHGSSEHGGHGLRRVQVRVRRAGQLVRRRSVVGQIVVGQIVVGQVVGSFLVDRLTRVVDARVLDRRCGDRQRFGRQLLHRLVGDQLDGSRVDGLGRDRGDIGGRRLDRHGHGDRSRHDRWHDGAHQRTGGIDRLTGCDAFGSEQRVGQDGQRRRARHLLRRLHQRTAELRGRVSIVGERPPGALEHCGERAEVGRHGHQLVNAVGQRRDRGIADEGHVTGDGFQQREAQRVDVALRLQRLALRFLRRAVLGAVHAAPGDVARRVVQHLREPDLHDPQSAIVAEHQGGRSYVGVHQPLAVDGVEGLAGIETDHQHLRRRQQTAAVEDVAQAATGEPLADHVEHVAVVPAGLAPVQHRGHVRVLQGAGDGHLDAELGLQVRHVAEVRVHQLEDDRALQLLVERFEDGGFQTAAQA